ncbi:MAG: Gldg family protein [Oscillospiraceae bacterium]|nr:Gldg family protein [Oscillospiraceae bacterium]
MADNNEIKTTDNVDEDMEETVDDMDITEETVDEAADEVTEDTQEPDADETSDDGDADADETSDDEDAEKDGADKKPADPDKAQKRKMSLRRMKYGSIATAITMIVIAVVVVINVILNLAADRVEMSVDHTGKGTFEISQETKDYLATVNEPVKIVCMSEENEFKTSNYVYYKQAYEVLKKYTIYGDTIDLKFVDLVKDPSYAQRYEQSYKGELSPYDIVVESEKRIKVMSIKDLYNVEINYNTFSQEVVSSKAEQELTSAIMYVTDPSPMKVAVFKSDTQSYSYDNVMTMLTANGYEVTEIDPLAEPIPEGTDMVVINAPLNDYDEQIIDGLYTFLDNGGALGRNLIYIADSTQKGTSNIDAFLAEWGIKVGSGVIGDDDSANRQTARSYYIIRDYIGENDYSANVPQKDLPVIDYQSRPIELLFDTKDTRSTVSLLSTADTAFVFTQELQAEYEQGNEVEIPHGSYVTWALGKKYVFNSDNIPVYSNVLVIGSGETLDESMTETTYFNNGDYFMSVVNTMTGKNTGISIVSKDLTSETFDLDEATFDKYRTIYMIVIPVAVVIIGAVVFARRRAK